MTRFDPAEMHTHVEAAVLEYGRRVPSGRVHHLVRGSSTVCGLPCRGTGWAVWSVAMNRRVDPMPLCTSCKALS